MSLNVVESTSYDVQNYSSVTWHSCVVFPFESCLISHTPFVWRLIVYDVTEYCLSYIYRARLCSKVRRRYDAVQFIANIHTALHWQQQGINQTCNSQEAPIPRPNGKLWVISCEKLSKIDRVMTVPYWINPFPVAFGALFGVYVLSDVTSVLMQTSVRTLKSVMLCWYVLLCLVVTKRNVNMVK